MALSHRCSRGRAEATRSNDASRQRGPTFLRGAHTPHTRATWSPSPPARLVTRFEFRSGSKTRPTLAEPAVAAATTVALKSQRQVTAVQASAAARVFASRAEFGYSQRT